MTSLVHRWELSPLQALAGWEIVPGYPEPMLPRKPLHRKESVKGTPWRDGLTMQLFVARESPCEGMRAVAEAQPDLVRSRRLSGVMALQGGEIVAAYIVGRRGVCAAHQLAVAPEYRGQGIGRALLLEWMWRVLRPRHLTPQRITVPGMGLVLSASEELYRLATTEGFEMPAAWWGELETVRSLMKRAQATDKRVRVPEHRDDA